MNPVRKVALEDTFMNQFKDKLVPGKQLSEDIFSPASMAQTTVGSTADFRGTSQEDVAEIVLKQLSAEPKSTDASK